MIATEQDLLKHLRKGEDKGFKVIGNTCYIITNVINKELEKELNKQNSCLDFKYVSKEEYKKIRESD